MPYSPPSVPGLGVLDPPVYAPALTGATATATSRPAVEPVTTAPSAQPAFAPEPIPNQPVGQPGKPEPIPNQPAGQIPQATPLQAPPAPPTASPPPPQPQTAATQQPTLNPNRQYTAEVEAKRATAAKYFPPNLVDKVLHVIQGESGGSTTVYGDGGAAYGLFQSHHIKGGATEEEQWADAFRLYQADLANGGTGFGDWGEGRMWLNPKTGKLEPFGALGRDAYSRPLEGATATASAGLPGRPMPIAATATARPAPRGLTDTGPGPALALKDATATTQGGTQRQTDDFAYQEAVRLVEEERDPKVAPLLKSAFDYGESQGLYGVRLLSEVEGVLKGIYPEFKSNFGGVSQPFTNPSSLIAPPGGVNVATPEGALTAISTIADVQGEALATVLDPLINQLPEAIREDVRHAVYLAPGFIEIGINPARWGDDIVQKLEAIIGATVVGSATERVGAPGGRFLGEAVGSGAIPGAASLLKGGRAAIIARREARAAVAAAKEAAAGASLRGHTIEELDARIPPEARVKGGKPLEGVYQTNEGTAFTDKPGLDRPGTGSAFADADIDRMWMEAVNESGTGARRAVQGTGAGPKGARWWNEALALPDRVRYWYELSAEAFKRKLPDLTDAERTKFHDLVGATSQNSNPLDNMRRALSALGHDLAGRPVTTALIAGPGQGGGAARKAFAMAGLAGNKIHNFAGTFDWLLGLDKKPPLSTNDRQVAKTFTIEPTTLQKNQALYEPISRFYSKLADAANEAGISPEAFQTWQLQALGWTKEGGGGAVLGAGGDYAAALAKIEQQARAAGLDMSNGFTREVLTDPRFQQVVDPTTKGFNAAGIGTIEVASIADPSNAAIAKLLPDASPKEIAALEAIERKLMRGLVSKLPEDIHGTPVPEGKRTSLAEDLVRAVGGDKRANVTRLDFGRGTFSGEAGTGLNANMRVPFATGLNADERRAFLATYGRALKQEAMAWSTFGEPAPGKTPTYTVFVAGTDRLTNGELLNFREGLGGSHELNIKDVPNGTVIEINPSFEGDIPMGPTEDAVQRALNDVWPTRRGKIYEAGHSSDYIESSEYDEILRGFDDAFQQGQLGRVSSVGASTARGARGGDRGAIEAKVEALRLAYERERAEWVATAERAQQRGAGRAPATAGAAAAAVPAGASGFIAPGQAGAGGLPPTAPIPPASALPIAGSGRTLYRAIPAPLAAGEGGAEDVLAQLAANSGDWPGVGTYWGDEKTAFHYGSHDNLVIGAEWAPDAISGQDANGVRIGEGKAGRVVSVRLTDRKGNVQELVVPPDTGVWAKAPRTSQAGGPNPPVAAPPSRGAPPPGSPPPGQGVPPTGGGAAAPQRSATQRVLGIQPVVTGLTKRDRAMNALKDVMGAGVKEDAFATPIMRERSRIQDNIASQASRTGTVAAKIANDFFPSDEYGRIRGIPGNPTIQDLAARMPEFDEFLTPAQKTALERLRGEAQKWHDVFTEQGLEVGSRPDVMEGGFYLPRGRADVEGLEAPIGPIRGGRGGRAGFEKSATFDSMTEGIEAGYKYASLGDAMESYARDAGRRSLDQWTADSFKQGPFPADVRRPTTAAERIDPQLRDEVQTLRARIVSSLDTFVRQNTRGNAQQNAADYLQRLLDRAEERAGRAMERLQVASGSPEAAFIRAKVELRLLDLEANRAANAVNDVRDRAAASLGRASDTADARQEMRRALEALESRWKAAQRRAAQNPRGTGAIDMTALQGTAFDEAIANAANRWLQEERPLTGAGAVAVNAVKAFNNIARGLSATADLSFAGINGLLGMFRDPAAYAVALKRGLTSIWDEQSLAAFVEQFDEAARAAGKPTSEDFISHGLKHGGRDAEWQVGAGLTGRLEAIGNLPIIKQANRAFGTFGDVLRLGLSRDFATGERNLDEVARVANLLTGWSRGRVGGSAGEFVQFAPRFFQSQLETLAMAMTNGGPAGEEARRSLMSLIGFGVLITVGANKAWGNDDFDYTTPVKDGRINPNFMKIRTPGVGDVSLFGPWDSMLRAVGSVGLGDPGYAARTKFGGAPIISHAIDLITGETFTGQPTIGINEPITGERLENFARSFGPFGVGQAGRQPIGTTLVGATGFKASPLTPAETRDEARNSVTLELFRQGKVDFPSYRQLNMQTQKAQVDADPRVAPKVTAARAAYPNEAQTKSDAVRSNAQQQEQDALGHFKTGTLDKPMPEKWQEIGEETRYRLDQIIQDFPDAFGNNKPDKIRSVTDPYYSKSATDPETGAYDPDATSQLRLEYMNSLGPTDRAIMEDYLKYVEGRRSPERQQYDAYIAKKKELGFFDPKNDAKAVVDLYRKHPEIDAQNWYWKSGVVVRPGEAPPISANPRLHSAEAVNQALAQNLPKREIKMAGLQRPINQTPQTAVLWKDYGNRLGNFLAGSQVVRDRERYAMDMYELPFDKLTESRQSSVETSIRNSVRINSPELDALLAYMGYTDTLLSLAAGPIYRDFKARFGSQPAYEGRDDVRAAVNAR